MGLKVSYIMSMDRVKVKRKNKFSIGNLVKARRKPMSIKYYNDFSIMPMLGIVTQTGIDYPDTGDRRSKYAEIKWSNGETGRIHLCHGTWDAVSVVG
jgi:hypothetical protein